MFRSRLWLLLLGLGWTQEPFPLRLIVLACVCLSASQATNPVDQNTINEPTTDRPTNHQVSTLVTNRVLSQTTDLKPKIYLWLSTLYDPTVEQLVLSDQSIDNMLRLSHALTMAADAFVGYVLLVI